MRTPNTIWYAKDQSPEEVIAMEPGSILNITGYFLLRIGLPVVLLVALGVLIDRWERTRRSTVDTSEFDALDAHEHAGTQR